MARGSLHLSMFVQGEHLYDERDVCKRPVALDCSFESACERCNFFETGPQFILILRRQRDHAVEQDQAERVELFDGLIKEVDGPS
jgi:hypothetical protein